MVKVINAKKVKSADLPLATDQECIERRKLLIRSGVIAPANKDSIVFRKNSSPVVNTLESSRTMRKKLIGAGIISTELCYVEPGERRCGGSNDQGEYSPRQITSDEEYERRKQIYFRMMQEILRSRRDLKLILGPKKDDDPDWYF